MLNALAKIGGLVRRSWTTGPYSIGDPALWGLLNTGPKSESGVVVTREVALSLSPIWKGVNIIANGCAKAGLHRYKRTGERGKTEDKGDPTYRLVRSAPNEYMDAFQMWRTVIAHALLTGNGYIAIERSNGGKPLSMLLLDPSRTWPVRKNKVLKYFTSYDIYGSTELDLLDPKDVIHIRGLGYDGLCGYSIIDILCDVIGGAVATRSHATTFFKRGAMLSGLLEYPGTKPDKATQDAIRDSWDSMYSGINNANKVAILFGGMKFNPLAVDAQKAQMVESRKFDIIELANLLLLPPYLLGDSAGQSYNSIEMKEKDIAAHAFDPWWTAIEMECDTKLLTDREKKADSHYFRWNRRAALQTDAKNEAETIKIEVESGLMTPDEARGLLDLPELPHGYGNVIFRPNANQTPLDLNVAPVMKDENAEFLQEYTKLLAADGTISSVIFNMTDAKKLLDAVNIPVFNGYSDPWLPVISQNGELVSGETLEDPEGNIVGGDTVKSEPEPDPADDPTGNGDMTSEDDGSEDQNLPPVRLKKLVSRAKRRKLSEITAIRDALADALRRKCSQILNEAKPAIKGNFVEYVNSLESRFGGDFSRATGPIFDMIMANGGDIKPVFRLFFDEIRRVLLLAAECRASELPDRVGFVMTVAGRSCKKLATMAALSGVKK